MMNLHFQNLTLTAVWKMEAALQAPGPLSLPLTASTTLGDLHLLPPPAISMRPPEEWAGSVLSVTP